MQFNCNLHLLFRVKSRQWLNILTMYKHNCFACTDDSNINLRVKNCPFVTTDKGNYLLSFQRKSLLCHFTMQLSCCSKLIWRHNNWTDYLTHIKAKTNGTKKEVQFITGLSKANNNYDVITLLCRIVSSSKSRSKCVTSSGSVFLNLCETAAR